MTKFLDNVDFIDLNMQTAIHASYDYTKSLDENLKEYTNQKVMQDESDQVNFLRQPAAGQAVEEKANQSVFWSKQKRGHNKTWMPNNYNVKDNLGARKRKASVPKFE